MQVMHYRPPRAFPPSRLCPISAPLFNTLTLVDAACPVARGEWAPRAFICCKGLTVTRGIVEGNCEKRVRERERERRNYAVISALFEVERRPSLHSLPVCRPGLNMPCAVACVCARVCVWISLVIPTAAVMQRGERREERGEEGFSLKFFGISNVFSSPFYFLRLSSSVLIVFTADSAPTYATVCVRYTCAVALSWRQKARRNGGESQSALCSCVYLCETRKWTSAHMWGMLQMWLPLAVPVSGI